MEPEPPSAPPDTPAPSLAQRAAAWRPAAVRERGERRSAGVAGRIALLIALGPVLAAGAATVDAMRLEREAAALRTREAVRLQDDAGRRRARAIWDAAGAAHMAGPIDALARRLPADARIVSVAQDERLAVRIATIDPDALRQAMRGEVALRDLRETAQARAGEGMVVTMQSGAK